ncbi:hypothetical protein, partial [Wenjunlia tyrosinilytica]|uniref:hypothetical protein n=1 Tax=Wenjunlia tyrosinilytica TaxID=1544741 RepID=UPI001E287CDE
TDAAFVGSTVSDSDTFSLVIDASSMIGSYTERFTVPHSATVPASAHHVGARSDWRSGFD